LVCRYFSCILSRTCERFDCPAFDEDADYCEFYICDYCEFWEECRGSLDEHMEEEEEEAGE